MVGWSEEKRETKQRVKNLNLRYLTPSFASRLLIRLAIFIKIL